MSSRNIRLTLAYDGTDFSGWQIQKNQRTVQGEVQRALSRMHGHTVKCTAAGRTDAGVHATGQVVNFPSDIESIAPERFRDAVNSHLPHDIRAMESGVEAEGFSARKAARWRLYRYYLLPAAVGYPHLRRYCYRIRRRLDVARLDRLAQVLIGEHDFTTFAAAGDANTSKKRRIMSSVCYARGEFVVYQIAADSFLWKMVRSIVGTLLELEEQGSSPEALSSILNGRDRSLAGQTAPARGLFLEKVGYDGKEYPL